MVKQIYIIYYRFIRDRGLITNIDNIAFTDKKKAIEYIEEKLNAEEIKKNRQAKARNFQHWYEFFSKDYIYYIKSIDIIK